MNPDLVYKLGDHFGDKFNDFGDKTMLSEDAGIRILSLPGVEISRTFERNLCDVCRRRYKILRAHPVDELELGIPCNLVN
ncbi:hypothetical protein AVEN_194589-1 [Araneus ventricosus]|uniref:Uncharacterized protein n=1 Tax=Araneus ventricosus TaxID=182803 RepID=A0A4Y2A763_ARAVE|nr:hypothetical protein AVEN_194589-1 [Araneus ventricosus]